MLLNLGNLEYKNSPYRLYFFVSDNFESQKIFQTIFEKKSLRKDVMDVDAILSGN